jgi:sodium transport system permease protein
LERMPRMWHLAAAAALAVVMHPLARRLSEGITQLYPVQSEALSGMKSIETALSGAPNWWVVIALMGLLPAICEELAIRGFVLSGLRHLGHKWWAIAISAIAFGAIHMFLQQKISAAFVGLALGYLAVQTGSLAPCIVFHAIHNSLGLLVAHLATTTDAAQPGDRLAWLLAGDAPLLYHPVTVACCGVCAAAILWSLRGTPYRPTQEEQLADARHERDGALVGA